MFLKNSKVYINTLHLKKYGFRYNSIHTILEIDDEDTNALMYNDAKSKKFWVALKYLKPCYDYIVGDMVLIDKTFQAYRTYKEYVDKSGEVIKTYANLIKVGYDDGETLLLFPIEVSPYFDDTQYSEII